MKDRRYTGQTSMLDEIIVDNFAGGGGASTGIELAAALVRANLPEWCEQPAIRSMTELERTVAAG